MLNIKKNYKCNLIVSPNNKGVKQSITLEQNKVAIAYEKIGIVIMKPVIDRILFSFTPTQSFLNQYDPGSNLDDYLSAIKTNAFQDAFMEVDGLSLLTGVPFKKPPFCNYNVNLCLQPCPKSDQIIILLAPKKAGHPFMRFDFNPNRVTAEGMKCFRKTVMSLLFSEMVQFSYGQPPF